MEGREEDTEAQPVGNVSGGHECESPLDEHPERIF
jgi:hypothetical protein